MYITLKHQQELVKESAFNCPTVTAVPRLGTHIARLKSLGAQPILLSRFATDRASVERLIEKYKPGTRFSIWGTPRNKNDFGHVFAAQIDSSGTIRFIETQANSLIRWNRYRRLHIIVHNP